MKYWDIAGGVDLFWDMVESGYIRVHTHPEFPELRIANYAEKTVFDREWNEATRASRGLIFNIDTGDVLARPFPKFFNYGEVDAAKIELADEVWVSDKMDGSLGIIYPAPDGSLRVATRGSFASKQALHATKVLNEKYSNWCALWKVIGEDTLTPLVEIIYPENRIVCDYGTQDDLVLLGWIVKKTGMYHSASGGPWDGPRARSFDFDNFSQVLAAAPRPGAEGFVVYSPRLNDWVKVKQTDYVIKHKLVSNLSKRSVWESLSQGNSVQEICDQLPDEFHNYVKEVARELQGQYQEAVRALKSDFHSILEELPLTYTRKDFAEKAKEADNTGWLFQMLDDKDYESSIWKSLRPEAER